VDFLDRSLIGISFTEGVALPNHPQILYKQGNHCQINPLHPRSTFPPRFPQVFKHFHKTTLNDFSAIAFSF
jgi:hypothetical protein